MLSNGENVPMQLNIDPEIRREFRVYAAAHDVDMSKLFVDMWQEYKEAHDGNKPLHWLQAAPQDEQERRDYFVRLIQTLLPMVSAGQTQYAIKAALPTVGEKAKR